MLRLVRSAYEDLLSHARAGTPEERCGLLAGDREEEPEAATVTTIRRVKNVAPNPQYTYEIDPEEQYELMEEVEERGLDLVGFYHSHPQGPAAPSTTDHERANWEGYHYLIVSLGGRKPVVDAWVWTGTRFERDAVAIGSVNE